MNTENDNMDSFTGYPSHHVTAFFNSVTGVEKALKSLDEKGISKDRIRKFYGRQGFKSIDPQGEEHGAWGAFVRGIHKIFSDTGEAQFFEMADRELKLGHWLVAVRVERREEKDPVAEIFVQCGARDIQYFDPFFVESITKDTERPSPHH
jgi:hypothetical protein